MAEIDKIFLNKKIKARNGFELMVDGDSMLPVLQSGDRIWVEYLPLYRIGDILLFRLADDLFVHRLYFQKDRLYYCKGDNTFSVEVVEKNNIIGCVKKYKRNGIWKEIPEMKSLILKLNILDSLILRKNDTNYK